MTTELLALILLVDHPCEDLPFPPCFPIFHCFLISKPCCRPVGILVWCASCTETDNRALQRLIKSTQRTTTSQLHSLKQSYRTRSSPCGVAKIIKDSSLSGHHLFTLLPTGRCRTTEKLLCPNAIKVLNSSS